MAFTSIIYIMQKGMICRVMNGCQSQNLKLAFAIAITKTQQTMAFAWYVTITTFVCLIHHLTIVRIWTTFITS